MRAAAPRSTVTICVDAQADRHTISPYIYGVAYGSTAALKDLNCPINRYGGNNASRYNWQLNADNRGSDWYFESLADKSAAPGERGDSFIAQTHAARAQPMLTIPTIGWVAKDGEARGKLASFSIAKYGPQTGNDHQWFPDAGNGISKSTGKEIVGNDPNDADIPVDSAFQQQWVQHLVSKWGAAAKNGLRYYLLDNEPSLWQATHRDVHPTGPTMQEIETKIVDYAAKIKQVDPTALIVAPEEWGWNGYRFSGYDQQYGNTTHDWSHLPDRAKHDGWDYLPWLLDQLHRHDQDTRQRSIDVFSIHWYPQSGEFGDDTSEAMQLRRNRSTRSLWDPDYEDESWIHNKVELIPRLKEWVKTYYPGLKIAITEYNWGAENHINGATAQADVLGIFGRQGLDMAVRWTCPDAATPTYKAIKLYRNYNGKRSAFGDISVKDSVPDPDNLASFAAIRSKDGALTVMVISKYLSGETPIRLSLAHFTPGPAAQVWQLTAANKITRLPNLKMANDTLSATVPAQSITLFVVFSSK